MKKIYLTTLILFVLTSTNKLLAEIIRTEYKQAINNNYKLEYTDNDRVLISNSVNPFENIPRSIWQEKVEITGHVGNLSKIVNNVIGPCIKHLSLNESDDVNKDMLFMSIDIGLDGIIKHITFGFSTQRLQQISLVVIENLETQITENLRFALKYKADDLGDVEYLNIVQTFSFYYIKKKFLSKPPLLPHPGDDNGLIPNY